MDTLILTNQIISTIKKEAYNSVYQLMGSDLSKMILYGSCARGDYHADSDVDIALITKCDRMTAKKYDDGLDTIATQLAMNYFAIVNFVCLPDDEFSEKKTWYDYFQNIEDNGEVIYG